MIAHFSGSRSLQPKWTLAATPGSDSLHLISPWADGPGSYISRLWRWERVLTQALHCWEENEKMRVREADG